MIVGSKLLDQLERDPHGGRVLRLLRDHSAEHRRGGRRAPHVFGTLAGVCVTADALVDLATGLAPPRVDLCWPDSPETLARELRRRARGQIELRVLQGAVELRSRDERRFRVRVLPSLATAAGVPEPLAERVVTVRAGTLALDGSLTDPGGDLEAGLLRLTDADALVRRPEALLHVARLAVRPGLRVSAHTYRAAVAARRAGAPATAPLAHLGKPLADLLAGPHVTEALRWLDELAPDLSLADGVAVDQAAIRAALGAAPDVRLRALLGTLAPDAPESRIRAFLEGTRLAAGP